MQQHSKPGLSPVGKGGAGGAPLRSRYADDPEMAGLVEMFVGELPARLMALESAWSAGDSAMLRRMAHQLSGAGAGYGFAVVSEAAAAVEGAIVACGGQPEEAALRAVGGKVQALIAVCRRAACG